MVDTKLASKNHRFNNTHTIGDRAGRLTATTFDAARRRRQHVCPVNDATAKLTCVCMLNVNTHTHIHSVYSVWPGQLRVACVSVSVCVLFTVETRNQSY